MHAAQEELLGTAGGFLGGILLALGPKSSKEAGQVTVAGDMASLAAAFAIIGYLLVGVLPLALALLKRKGELCCRVLAHAWCSCANCFLLVPRPAIPFSQSPSPPPPKQVGRTLRKWMPIFIYAFPVTGIAAVQLTLAALAIERQSMFKAGEKGVFGWAADAHFAPYVLYLALGPGIVGHTGFNTLLRYLTPLTVSRSPCVV